MCVFGTLGSQKNDQREQKQHDRGRAGASVGTHSPRINPWNCHVQGSNMDRDEKHLNLPKALRCRQYWVRCIRRWMGFLKSPFSQVALLDNIRLCRKRLADSISRGC